MRSTLAPALVFGSWIACFTAGLAVGGGFKSPPPPAPEASAGAGQTTGAAAPPTVVPTQATQRTAAAPSRSHGLTAEEQATIELFRSASPCVVFITSTALRRDAWTLNPIEIPAGSGTGFVWDKQGHIVTNFHVIQKCELGSSDPRRSLHLESHPGGCRAREGSGGAAHRRAERRTASDSGRRLERAHGRASGVRDRQSVRARSDA